MRAASANVLGDADALAYIAAVEAADGQALESGVKDAITAFVVGCKADNIWTAIKASCILAGARTLAGCLVPLAGVAPTNVGPFTSGDYNRKTGLVGNGTKYLDANRNNTVDPQNNRHLAVYATTKSSLVGRALAGYTGAGGRNRIFLNSVNDILTNCTDAGNVTTAGSYTAGTGLYAISRDNSNTYAFAYDNLVVTLTAASSEPGSGTTTIYAMSASNPSSPRLAFYSIGESLNLALLRARVTTLINAYAAAIP